MAGLYEARKTNTGGWLLRASRAVARELRACSSRGMAPALAARVLVEQVDSLSVTMTVMSVTGLGTAMLTLYAYWNEGAHALLAGTVAAITVCYGLLIRNGVHWLRGTPLSCGGAKRMLRADVITCICLGLAWAILEMLLMARAGPGQRSLLYGIVIGMMSAPAMVTPCSAAFAFWVPVTVGGLVSIGLLSGERSLEGGVLLVGYTGMSLFCLLYLNRSLLRRVVAEIEQSDQRETIDLLLREFENSAGDWLWETDAAGYLTHVSARFAEAAGMTAPALLGAHFLDHLVQHALHVPQASPLGSQAKTELAILVECRTPFRDMELDMRVNGQHRCWSLAGKPKYSQGGAFDGYRGVGSDITDKRAAMDRAAYLASYDELTGLANRRLLRETLTTQLATVQAGRVALLLLDLDGFKAVNDRHGHPVGDSLLRLVSARLRRQLREGDLCARLGGDEFAVVACNLPSEALSGLARRLIEDLSAPYEADGYDIKVGTSIGVAIAESFWTSADQLFHRADAALYRAKSSGRGTWRIFDEELRAGIARRDGLQAELSVAIARGDLHLAFQPIFDIQSGRLSSVEALARWLRADGEMVPPSEFVAVAESCGLISELGDWVLLEASKLAVDLPGDIRLAINISPTQLRDRDLLTRLPKVFAETGLNPRRLEFELTENAFLDMTQTTLDLLDEIRAFGIGINLDDFGVGQTSLDYLRRYPFSTLKIDQSFIRDMPTSKASRAIVRGVVSMARELGIKTTAEGIETKEHLAVAREVGCEQAQGYLLGRPVSIGRIRAMLEIGGPLIEASPAD
jgi:diguanylate cyclase (GGDEF)-like protein